MPLYIAKSGDLDRCYRCLTDRLTTLKDRATQLLISIRLELSSRNCVEVEIDARQIFVLPSCAKPFKVSVHGLLLLPVRLMHKLNKQVLIGELPPHNIESSC